MGGMFRASSHAPIRADHRGPLLIAGGLTVVLVAQLWPMIPVAAAISLIGLGATVTLARRPQSEPVLVVNIVVYGALTLLAVGAQLDIRYDALTLCDVVAAGALIIRAISESLARTDSC